MTINVGIVDDSVMVRSVLERMINGHEDFQIVGKASDVYEARTMIMEKDPDVLTLDVEMPDMDGITFLDRLMEHQPMPVVMVSSLTRKTSRKGMEALEKGAVDVVGKPQGDTSDSIQQLEDELMPKLEAAYRARKTIGQKQTEKPSKESNLPELDHSQYDLILIGSSTGGVEAIKEVFTGLSDNLPPILVVQHMPPVFTRQFADRIDGISSVNFAEAEDGSTAGWGEGLLAPGDQHMEVRRLNSSGRVKVQLNEDEDVHSQRPSVEVLFESAAQRAGHADLLGLVLTGMGKDGQSGSVSLAQKGATILTQDEKTSVVYGMPKRVQEAVDSARSVPLDQISELLNQLQKNR
jgi:two-component system chemotaxis response regulator CheB